jgi:DNA-directed RNA polymerase subunit RPC12/RpoP
MITSGELRKTPCPTCGKKGLSFAPHPHAFGYKDYERANCRYCGGRFILKLKRKDAK